MDKKLEFVEAVVKLLQSNPPVLDETAKIALGSILTKAKAAGTEKQLNEHVFQAFIISAGLLYSKNKMKGLLNKLLSFLGKFLRTIIMISTLLISMF